jgi:hypothetical protein
MEAGSADTAGTTSGTKRAKATDLAAVTGVVIAGVLASFVIPGPFDWGSTLIGIMLLVVLVGFVEVPESRRETAAIAAAAGFVLLLIFARPLDETSLSLSDWPETGETREALDTPDKDDGWPFLIAWTVFTAVSFLGMRGWRKWGPK